MKRGFSVLRSRIITLTQGDNDEAEPSELSYFKLYRSRSPVVEQALEYAVRMLGSDKSRGYCLEMICADFLAGCAAKPEMPRAL